MSSYQVHDALSAWSNKKNLSKATASCTYNLIYSHHVLLIIYKAMSCITPFTSKISCKKFRLHVLKIIQGMDHSLFPWNNLLQNEMRFVICFFLKTWTNGLCRKDSDGDGKTNGEELGDPDCEWSPNSVPKSTVSLSHPGKWPGVVSNWNSILP